MADPSRRLAELPLLAAEEERTLASWSDAALEHPRRATLHELFEAQVDATPDAPAVTFEGRPSRTASSTRAPTASRTTSRSAAWAPRCWSAWPPTGRWT